jgi:hypothetical protein
MIALRCSNCHRVQELDNAFAGCVCRCRFCQAIQTVPRKCPSVPAGQAAIDPVTGPQPILLHCPDSLRRRREQAVLPEPSATDRTLIVAVGVAALLALGAAGGAIALLRSTETYRPATSADTGAAQLDRVSHEQPSH